MFSKILIANRGEIACRVMRTARRMGLATVAVYSDADATALHVRMADEAVRIGPAPARDSYLCVEAIVAAARATGAGAIHPGYGFLSENADFATRLRAEGIVFVGPDPRAIDLMGDKIRSKEIARSVGVSTIPGHPGAVESLVEAERVAAAIGYPLMIKASAGGGGKGMRVAQDAASLRDGFERARSEAASSFGDDRLLIERFVVNPRHIEMQILADAHGNVIHLGERECSVQRRNQKVVEEAPSPFVDATMRERMGAEAVALARAVDYRSAGTVEFVVGEDRAHYFLEMNTRLQVEHPVTEGVHGVDLVEEMIRIAGGGRLALRQEDVVARGCAVETRIYAEDPSRGFLPSVGRLTTYAEPAGARVDSGVEEGDEISIHYDPMIAKLVTTGETREAAIDRQILALDAFAIEGIRHNIPFLATLMRHPRWREGRLSTGFIAEEFPDGHRIGMPGGETLNLFLAVAAAMGDLLWRRRARLAGAGPAERSILVGTDVHDIAVSMAGDAGGWSVTLANVAQRAVASSWRPGQPVWRGTVDGTAVSMAVAPKGGAFVLSHGGRSAEVRMMTRRAGELQRLMPIRKADESQKHLLCPMPGLVRAILVEKGQEVRAGEGLAVVEAMKMENLLRAERDGRIEAVHAREGDVLAVDALILEFA